MSLLLLVVCRSSENVPLKSNDDGSYVASWVPSTSGSYIIQVFIDGKSAGTQNAYTISQPILEE